VEDTDTHSDGPCTEFRQARMTENDTAEKYGFVFIYNIKYYFRRCRLLGLDGSYFNCMMLPEFMYP